MMDVREPVYLEDKLAEVESSGKLAYRSQTLPTWCPGCGYFSIVEGVGKAMTELCLETGRPLEVPGQDYKDGLALVQPTAFGGHNWHPMSYNPNTGLVYIPAQEIVGAYRVDPEFTYRPGSWNTGTDMNVFSQAAREHFSGHLLAWDPVAQREAWRHQHGLPWNGGTLTTGGDLVFQGTADGRFVAYRATDGEKLWESYAGTGIIAAPVTYTLDGVQHVTVVAGWGGAFALIGGPAAAATGVHTNGKVLTYTLAGPPPEPAAVAKVLF